MNLILLEPDEICDNQVTLEGRRFNHIRKVLHSKEGDILTIGVVGGAIGTGRVVEILADHVVLEVNTTKPPPVPSSTDLILALPRPIMLKRVLAQAAAMGIARIYLINTHRVEKSFFNASLLEEQNYTAFLRLGLEQAVDTNLPKISIHQRFRPFVEDLLPEISSHYPVRLIAHPVTERSLSKTINLPFTSKALLAIGPEGGWVDFEVDKLEELGFKPFTLGARILRVDTVVPALIAQLDLLRQL